MRGHATAALACTLVALVLTACGSTARQTPDTGATLPEPALQAEQPAAKTGFPSLGDLAEGRSALAIQDHEIPVTTPTWQQHTTVEGGSLLFNAPADELAYAIYQVAPPWGSLETLTGTGEGPLWLAVADYGTERWVYIPFEDGQAEIDLTGLDDPYSLDGYFICGVISPQAQSGRLDALTLAYDEFGDWNLTITTDENSITLNWNEFPVDYYEIYRSMLPDDPAPHHVGTVVEEHTGGNSFVETVPEDGTGRWVPENNDNGTPGDSTDDFPTIAPEVDYYYSIVPRLGNGMLSVSPEVSGRAAWGDRWSGRREWPDTTNQTLLFGSHIDAPRCTEAQLQWCAENLVGVTGLLQSEIDTIRSFNSDFIVLGAHHGVHSSLRWQNWTTRRKESPDYNVYVAGALYGDEWDPNGAYPYIDKHEDWFIHHPESDLYHERSDIGYFEGMYWMDLSSGWIDYCSTNFSQLLGEDCFDGWKIDGVQSIWDANPEFWGILGYGSLAEYQQAHFGSFFNKVKNNKYAHPRAPYIFADAFIGATIKDPNEQLIYYYHDYSACDGVVVSEFLSNGMFSGYNSPLFWFIDNDCNAILDLQQDGKIVILQYEWYTGPYRKDLGYCCYLLVRESNAYYYTMDEYYYGIPFWDPMFTWKSGVPLNGQPESIDDLLVGEGDNQYLRRDFENGIVLVIPAYVRAKSPEGSPSYEYMETVGGTVNEDGSVPGNIQWEDVEGFTGYSIYESYDSAWIMRPVAE